VGNEKVGSQQYAVGKKRIGKNNRQYAKGKIGLINISKDGF